MKTIKQKWDLGKYMSSENGDIDFPKMESEIPFIESLKNCAQDSKYHSEGNVWIHTQMVLKALFSIPEFNELPKEEKEILLFAALFHDIGKPSVTKEEDGKIASKKHSVVGARMARRLLWGEDGYPIASWSLREAVSNLTLLHMLPFYLIEKEDPVYSILASSQVIKNKWLYILGTADINGRNCKSPTDQKQSENSIEMFKDFCIENECYESPRAFKSDIARFRYFFEQNGHPDIDYYEEIRGNVTIMSGIQGSGKNFTINKEYRDIPVIGLDETRKNLDFYFGEDEGWVMRETKESCREFMRDKQDFIFNATNTVKEIRSKWIRFFRSYKYKIKIHYIEKTLDVTLAQNRKRTGQELIPEDVIYDKFARLDVPTLLECHNLVLNVPK